jgi:hypothetical protein
LVWRRRGGGDSRNAQAQNIQLSLFLEEHKQPHPATQPPTPFSFLLSFGMHHHPLLGTLPNQLAICLPKSLFTSIYFILKQKSDGITQFFYFFIFYFILFAEYFIVQF